MVGGLSELLLASAVFSLLVATSVHTREVHSDSKEREVHSDSKEREVHSESKERRQQEEIILPVQYDMITPSRNLTDVRLQSRICGPACGGCNAACRAMCTVSLVKIGADIGMLDSTKAINELYDAINDLR